MIEQLGDNLIPVIAISGGLLVGFSWILTSMIENIAKTWINSRLKTRMLEQGFSASEISQVMSEEIGTGQTVVSRLNRPAPPVKQGPASWHDA